TDDGPYRGDQVALGIIQAHHAHRTVDVEEEAVQRRLLDRGAQPGDDLRLPALVHLAVQLPAGKGAGVEDADVLGRLPQLPAGLRTGGEEREAAHDLRGAAAHLEIRRRGAVRGERRGLDGDAGEGDPGQGGHVRVPPSEA